MEVISNLKHDYKAFLYALSRLIERAAYFGLISMISIYLVREVGFERVNTLEIYGWFTSFIIITPIIGAFIGDLLIGNKDTIIIGGVLQALGAFVFSVPSTTSIYLGLGLIGLGTGFYSPNLIAQFGKLYLNKIKLLDSGFIILFAVVNIGGFFGPFLLSKIRNEGGFRLLFIAIGILYLLSVFLLLFVKDVDISKIELKKYTIKKSWIFVSISIVFVGLFWTFYEMPSIYIFEIQTKFKELSFFEFDKDIKNMPLYVLMAFPIGVLAIFFWRYIYYSQLTKLFIGFTLAALAYSLLLYIPEQPTSSHLSIFLVGILLLGIAETHILPIVFSTITKYTNPKYLAIAVSVSMLITRLFYLLIFTLNDKYLNKSYYAYMLSFIGMLILSILVLLLIMILKKDFLIKNRNKN